MREIVAKFEVVTPMFAGGANVAQPEIRLPSILGQLRWWWRALAWSRTRGTNLKRLNDLHGWESKLFGSAADGTGAFSPRVLTQASPIVRDSRNGGYAGPLINSGAGIAYCLGQGLKQRKAFAETTPFELRLLAKPRVKAAIRVIGQSDRSKDEPPTLAEAIWAFGLLGGMGSRMRRGFGSVTLRQWNVPNWPVPCKSCEYEAALRDLYRNFVRDGDAQPPFSAFAPSVQMVISTWKDVVSLHDEMGAKLHAFRDCKSPRDPYRQRFLPDHDWFYAVTGNVTTSAPASGSLFHENSTKVTTALSLMETIEGVPMPVAPERAIFGLPHNYSRTKHNMSSRTKRESHQYKADISPTGGIERRASPLMLHIHQLADVSAAAVWMLFESDFLPGAGPQLSVSRSYVFKKEKRGSEGWCPDGKKTALPSRHALQLPFQPDYGPARVFMASVGGVKIP